MQVFGDSGAAEAVSADLGGEAGLVGLVLECIAPSELEASEQDRACERNGVLS